MHGLTAKQFEILTFIQRYIEEHHYSPSYREIMEHFDFSSTGTVYKHIQVLQRKGVLTANKQSKRSLLPVKEAVEAKSSNELILPFIGYLSIGYPLELFIQSENMAVPATLVASPETTYILQVQGDTLKEESIINGDLLLIETRQEIEAGEMVLGLINQHDSFLKRYYPEGHYIRLEGMAPHPSSMTLKHELISIQGVLAGLIRAY